MAENKIRTLVPQSIQSFIEGIEVGETIAIELNGLTTGAIRQAVSRVCENNEKAYSTRTFGSIVHVTRHF